MKRLLVLLALTMCACGNSEPSTTSSPTSSQAPDSDLVVLDAADKAALDAALKQDVTVEGTVSTVTLPRATLHFDFEGTEQSKFYAMVPANDAAAFQRAFGGNVAKTFPGRTIRVTGKLLPYRNQPQIVINKPEQVVIVK